MQNQSKVDLPLSWKEQILDEFQTEHMQKLKAFLQKEFEAKKRIYPKSAQIFQALKATDFEKVKVVILGQDPYHGPGQAHGLCFSVQKGVPAPPSLKNIFKELQSDLGFEIPSHGDLSAWAEQGVLLLNATLTVEANKAGSHQKRGWEEFTDRVIRELNEKRDNLVFLLWGSYAQKKAAFVDPKKHLVLKAPHPSPLSAHRGFLGCRHFSKCNSYLKSKNIQPVEWQI